MRRGLTGVLVLGLLAGGVAACSDDDDGGDATGTTTTAAAGDAPQESTTAAGGEGDEPQESTTTESEVVAANDAVIQEYCDASIANDEALQASLDAPDDEAARDALAETSGRLGEASDAVAPVVETFTPEQQAQFEECQS
jgi:hypothetical protein